jgi:hypothetical protein
MRFHEHAGAQLGSVLLRLARRMRVDAERHRGIRVTESARRRARIDPGTYQLPETCAVWGSGDRRGDDTSVPKLERSSGIGESEASIERERPLTWVDGEVLQAKTSSVLEHESHERGSDAH